MYETYLIINSALKFTVSSFTGKREPLPRGESSMTLGPSLHGREAMVEPG